MNVLLIYFAMILTLWSITCTIDNVTVEIMSDVSVLLEMIMVRNHMMTCDLNYAEVADIIERITVS